MFWLSLFIQLIYSVTFDNKIRNGRHWRSDLVEWYSTVDLHGCMEVFYCGPLRGTFGAQH
jgi:hypothetical protein